ncbi:hypothetical protein ACWEKM_19105 [Streptomyces sp. NPDC004752]
MRGPALKDRFLVSDRETGRTWWQYGTAKESQDEAERKRMSEVQIGEVISALAERGII